MRKIVVLIFIVTLCMHAEVIAVVVGKQTPIEHLSAHQIKAVFLKKREFLDGIRMKPINLSPKSPLRRSFEKHLLKMDSETLERYWVQVHYRGHRPPYRVNSIESMIRFVERVRGAVGYLPQHEVPKDLKVLYRIAL